jgi:hypothetical protein
VHALIGHRVAPTEAIIAEADRLVLAARAMAARLRVDATLFTFGVGWDAAAARDAAAAFAGPAASDTPHRPGPRRCGVSQRRRAGDGARADRHDVVGRSDAVVSCGPTSRTPTRGPVAAVAAPTRDGGSASRVCSAFALAPDAPAGADGPRDAIFARPLRALARPGDIALALDSGPAEADTEGRGDGGSDAAAAVFGGLRAGRSLGLLTVALAAGAGSRPGPGLWPARGAAGSGRGETPADHVVWARGTDPLVIAEVQLTMCHLMAELVRIDLDRTGRDRRAGRHERRITR